MNPYKRRPYVSISGVASPDEARHILRLRSGLDRAHHMVAIGLLATDKTLAGEPRERHPLRYPHVQRMRDILASIPAGPHGLVLLHYAPSSLLGLTQLLARAVNLVGIGLDGVQINASGVSYRDIGPLRRLQHVRAGQDFRIVLQLRLEDLHVDDVERTLNTHLAPSSGTIDDVLLDASCGDGRDMDVDKAGALIELLRGRYRAALGVGIGGGITPANVGRLKPLIDKFGRELSINMESGVRDASDRLDPVLVGESLRATFALFGEA